MTDKSLYQQVTDEFSTNRFDQALWSMVWTKAGGDENKAKAAYVEARVRELSAQQKLARKAAVPKIPFAERRWWRVAGLYICALVIVAINRHVSESFQINPSATRWDFYITGLLAGALGLSLVPGAVVLVGWGSYGSYRLAFVFLIIAGFFAGIGGLPAYDPDREGVMHWYVGILVIVLLTATSMAVSRGDFED